MKRESAKIDFNELLGKRKREHAKSFNAQPEPFSKRLKLNEMMEVGMPEDDHQLELNARTRHAAK